MTSEWEKRTRLQLPILDSQTGHIASISYGLKERKHEALEKASNEANAKTAVEIAFEKANKGKYSFAGEYARTANVARYADAKRLEEEGKKPSEIYSQTGWYKGMDGKWRFEIDDSRATPRQVKVTNKTRLADIMEHEQIFDAYPALANLKVALSDLMTGSQNASYMGDRISLPSEAPMGNHALRKNLTRENGDDDAA